MRIRSQLLLILTGIVLVPLIAAGVLLHNTTTWRQLDQAQDRLHLLALGMAGELNSMFRNAIEAARSATQQPALIEYLGSGPEAREQLQATVNRLLRSVAVHDPVNVNSCALFDVHGAKLADSSTGYGESFDESTMHWITGPLSNGEAAVDTTTSGPGGRAIWVGVPMHDSEGRISGVLRMRMEISMLQQVAMGLEIGSGDEMFAIVIDDEAGTILAHSANPARIGTPPDPIEDNPRRSSTRGPRPAKAARGSFSRQAQAGASPDHLSLASLELAPWRVGIVQTDNAFDSARDIFRRTLIAVGGLVAGLILVTGLIASKKFSSPISELASAANDIDAGRLDRVVPERGSSEVRALTRALNNMTGRLSRTLKAAEERALEFQAIFEGSPAAMAQFDAQDRFVRLNSSFTSLFGYTPQQLPDLNAWFIRAYPDPAYRAEVIKTFETRIVAARNRSPREVPSMEAIVTCRDGTRRHIEFRSLWTGEGRLATFTDLTPHKQAQRVREIMLDSLGGLSGRDFFERLALEAAALFSANRVYIGRFASPASDVQGPLVIWHRGAFVDRDRTARSVAGGPAEVLRNEGRFVYWPDVGKAFPLRADGYRSFGIVSYAGLPLRNSDGRVVGTISVMFDNPLSDPEPLRASLELLASRAAMELDRLAAAETLRESEERYRTLVTHAPDAIVVFDCETGKFVDCNENAEKLFKLPRETLLQRSPVDLSPATQSDGRTSSEAATHYVREAVAGRLQTFEWLHQDGDGAILACEVRLVRLPDPNRTLLRGSILDLSESKRALAELQQSERRFAAIFNESPVGMAITSIEEGMVLDANPAVCKMLGFTREEVLGRSTNEFTTWEPGEREALMRKLSGGNESAMIEKILRRSDGSERTVQTQFIVIELGDRKRMLVAMADITERKRAEDILRENEERFRLLIENSNELVVLVNGEGTILYASPNHAAITGYAPEEMVGTNAIDRVHPDDRAAVAPKLNETAAASVFRFRFKDGSWHWIESSGRKFTLASGERRGVVVSRDISSRVAAEEARKVLETQLRQSQKLEAIGTLAGGIAHDFNNILTGVMGHIELALLDLPRPHAMRSQLEDSLNACKRARDLIGQILTFSRQREPSRNTARIGPIVKEAMRLLRASLPSRIDISMDVDDHAPAIDCDVTQIHQVVMNLGTNAAHAMGSSGLLTVSLRRIAPDPETLKRHVKLTPAHMVRLSIRDTGSGMDAATLERIFDPFFTTKEPGEGTGLGLPVVHGIMEEHGGVIVVESTPGEGTCFDLYFRPVAADNQPKTSVASAQFSLPDGTGKRVLLVDDEATIRNVGARILQRIGYDVLPCSSAVEALEYFKKDPGGFDLVLSDLTMPEMNGVEFARVCLAIRPEIPFVVMTGYLKSAEIDTARAAGLTHFLRKPFDIPALVEVLNGVCAPKT